jgi:hypothetical protein
MENIERSGSNWGRTPRTVREAFPQYPDSHYVEPSMRTKIYDVFITIAIVGVFAIAATVGTTFFFGG